MQTCFPTTLLRVHPFPPHPELPQQHACTEEEEELCDQERSSSLDQEEPEPPQVKEEQEELCTSQEGEHLVLKQEDDFLKTSCTYERSDNSNGWSARLDPDQNQTAADSEPPDSVSCKTTISESERERPRGPEQISDHQPLFHTSHLADNKDCKGGNRGNAANPKKNTVSATYSQLKPSDRSFKCNICSEDFNLYTQLEVHKRTHTAEKPFICTVCGRGFSFSRYLRQHMITHSVERPYSCNTCWKSFRRFEHLQVHTRSHTGEKPYRCVYCEKAFSSRRALTKHVQLHTGEKPYSCGTWGELLRQEQKLRETSKEKSPPTTQPGRSKFLSSQRFL